MGRCRWWPKPSGRAGFNRPLVFVWSSAFRRVVGRVSPRRATSFLVATRKEASIRPRCTAGFAGALTARGGGGSCRKLARSGLRQATRQFPPPPGFVRRHRRGWARGLGFAIAIAQPVGAAMRRRVAGLPPTPQNHHDWSIRARLIRPLPRQPEAVAGGKRGFACLSPQGEFAKHPARHRRRAGTPKGRESGLCFFAYLSCTSKKVSRPPGRDPANAPPRRAPKKPAPRCRNRPLTAMP